MSELSELFGAPAEEGAELDFNAIFGGGVADASPIPVEEPKTEAAEPHAETETVEAKPTETPEDKASAEKKNTDKTKHKKPEAEPEPDLFSAFNQQSDEEAPPAPAPAEQVSLFDKPAVFSYGSAKEPIEDASVPFEELRIRKSEYFPELESGTSVSWRVRYGAITKSVTDPKEDTVAKVKEEIERSKAFLDGLKKAKSDKDRSPECLISPVVTAKSKGIASYAGVFSTVEAARASDKVICILPAQDGHIYEMRKNEMGEFIAPKKKVVDFAEVRAGFTPALPLIPRDLTGQIISFFRCFMSGTAEYEAMVFVYWDRREQEFVAFVPKQTTTKASIHAELAENTLPEERYLHYADIHSHNSMAAEFSSIDDADERATRLYIVIGRLDKFYPDVTARVSCGGTYLPIDPHLVMEGIGEDFPTEWLEQVERVSCGGEKKLPWPRLFPDLEELGL